MSFNQCKHKISAGNACIAVIYLVQRSDVVLYSSSNILKTRKCDFFFG